MLYNLGGMTAWDKKSAINVYKLHLREYKATLSLYALDNINDSERVLSEIFGVTQEEIIKIKNEIKEEK